jgi:hypothetical protein
LSRSFSACALVVKSRDRKINSPLRRSYTTHRPFVRFADIGRHSSRPSQAFQEYLPAKQKVRKLLLRPAKFVSLLNAICCGSVGHQNFPFQRWFCLIAVRTLERQWTYRNRWCAIPFTLGCCRAEV